MAATAETAFEPLPIRRRTLLPTDPNQYNVTDSSSQTKQIKANTAYEAFKLSGFKEAIKIERISNLDRPLLNKEQFKDDAVSKLAGALVGANPEDGDAFFQTSPRRKLIVSADELDALMHTLQEIADHMPVERVPIAAIGAGGAVPGPTGMDVKGEGFDEIIPASYAAKPVMGAKPIEPKAAQTIPQAATENNPANTPAVADRELSHEEIEKLLGGK